jgi:hypothetical protein
VKDENASVFILGRVVSLPFVGTKSTAARARRIRLITIQMRAEKTPQAPTGALQFAPRM